MPQLFTDIKKPGVGKKIEEFVKREEKKVEQKIIEKNNIHAQKPKSETPKLPRPKHSHNWLIPIFLVLIFIFGLGVYSYFFSVGAAVTIWPKMEPLSQDVQLTIDKSAQGVNLFSKTIPGTLLQEERTISQDIKASGQSNQGTKATGTVRIYNNYSTAAQALVANTRLMSSGGKLFRTAQRIVVPGQTTSGGKVQPGVVDVKVTADQPGDDYNIDPSDFSIPGFVGTPKYTGFYGKSTAKMTGGYQGVVAQITQKDIDSAKALALQKISEETRQGLKDKITSDYLYLDSAVKDQVSDVKVPKAGDAGKTFTIQVTGSSSVIAFKKADLDEFVSQSILFQKPQEKTLYKESVKSDYALSSSQIDVGKLILVLKISANLYTPVDEEKIKESILGVAPAQIKETMSTNSAIDKIEVKLLPPWSNSVPKDKSKISVKINLGV